MTSKVCFKCKQEKDLSEFYKHPQMGDGHVNKCKECNKKDVREDWNKKRYEKKEYDKNRQRYSIRRIMNHRYGSLKRRCLKGATNDKPLYVTGKDFLSKEEFVKWFYDMKNYKIFSELYSKWVKSDFDRKLIPSIDRIDNKGSYFPENMQWLTQSANSSKGNRETKTKNNEKLDSNNQEQGTVILSNHEGDVRGLSCRARGRHA